MLPRETVTSPSVFRRQLHLIEVVPCRNSDRMPASGEDTRSRRWRVRMATAVDVGPARPSTATVGRAMLLRRGTTGIFGRDRISVGKCLRQQRNLTDGITYPMETGRKLIAVVIGTVRLIFPPATGHSAAPTTLISRRKNPKQKDKRYPDGTSAGHRALASHRGFTPPTYTWSFRRRTSAGKANAIR